MTIRTKLLIAFAVVVLLVVVQGVVDLRYALATRSDTYQLGRVVLVGSRAAHGMMSALSQLEACTTAPFDDGANATNHLQRLQEGDALFQSFRGCLEDAAEANGLGNSVQAPGAERLKAVEAEQAARLDEISNTLAAIEIQWREFARLQAASPKRAESLRDNFLLPALNEELRPSLIRFDQNLEEESLQEAQDIFQESQQSHQMMLLILTLAALTILTVGFLLLGLILRPLRQLADASRDVAAGNRRRRLEFGRRDEFGVMAGAFNHMLDVLQTTSISRDELEVTVRERTAELEDEIKVRRAIETELRRSEQNLATTLNSIGDGVLVANAAGLVVRMNPVAEQLTGWQLEHAFGRPAEAVFRIVNEDSRLPVNVPVREAIARNKIIGLTNHTLLVSRTGDEHPIANSCAPIQEPDGRVLGAVLVFRDVTEERLAAEQILRLNRELEQRVENRTSQLRESERRHRTLLANLPGMAYRCRADRRGIMEFASEGSRDLLGLEPDALTGGRVVYSDLLHPEDREQVEAEVRSAIARRGSYTLEYRIKHADGRWRSVWEQGRAVFDDRGQMAALEGFITDITQRVEAEHARQALENQLRQAQKLEAIGTLAGGIAHDFNNVLAAILGSAELVKMDLPPEHPSREFVDQIFVAGRRAREVVQQILTFSQRRESERSIIHLQSVVKECCKLLRSTIPAMVDISHHINRDCASVLADPTQIHQVIMNLCTNSWHALPETGGRIQVDLDECALDDAAVAALPGLVAGPHVRLSISDNGCGMDTATLGRIFEPFFTTKPAGKGSGLGLAVVHGIVKNHEGAIAVKSEPGQGTTFQIYFPAQTSEQPEAPPESGVLCTGHNERILLVDDDHLPGRTMEKMLNRLGYQVRWFQHPEQALADFRAAPAAYDLVVTDLSMPGMSGDNLAATLLTVRPDIPILLTTGMIDPAIQKQAREMGVRNVLLKPVTAATLGREIAQIFGR